MKCLMLCEERGRLLDAYVTATDRQAEAVKALSGVAAKDNRAAFREALAHAEQPRQDAEEARLALHLHSKLMAPELRAPAAEYRAFERAEGRWFASTPLGGCL